MASDLMPLGFLLIVSALLAMLTRRLHLPYTVGLVLRDSLTFAAVVFSVFHVCKVSHTNARSEERFRYSKRNSAKANVSGVNRTSRGTSSYVRKGPGADDGSRSSQGWSRCS
jgi:hypothetical protein